MGIVMIHDLVNPETGKTYKQENMEIQHQIPIGSLVEVEFSRWFGDGCLMRVHGRLWVTQHTRDCDGTPLYSISRWKEPFISSGDTWHGFGEDALTVIEPTPEIVHGHDVPDWFGEED